jgi:HEPN domain-containing protein
MSAKQTDSYFELAEDGLKTCEILFREDQFRDAVYNAQQVAERVARALLTHANKPFGTSHNLAQMAEALPADHPLRPRIKEFDNLSPAATKYRYPTPSGRLVDPPQVSEIRKALNGLTTLLREPKSYVYGPQPSTSVTPKPKGSGS